MTYLRPSWIVAALRREKSKTLKASCTLFVVWKESNCVGWCDVGAVDR